MYMAEDMIASLGHPCFVVLVAINGLLLLFGLLIIIFKHYLPLFLNHGGCLPKGSFGWPLLGETLAFLKPHASNALGSFLQAHSSRYGKVFKSHLFFSPAIVSCDQELNYFILQNEDKLFQCSYPKPIHGVLGQSSMLVVVGELHRRLRGLALTLVTTTKSSPHYLRDIETTALQIITSWKSKPHVIFCQEARKFTFNVIVKQVLGLTPEDPQTERILDDFRAFMKGLISFPLYIPGTPYARAVQARARISSTVKALIEERRSRINNNNYDNNNNSNDDDDENKKGDFLEVLLRVKDLSEDEKVSFVLDALLGGYETTSLLMSMAVQFLGQSPPALHQLKEEFENIRSTKKKGEYLNWEDYKKMGFTQNVIQEALRCGNIVKFVHRKAIRDVKFKDYFIPSGWKVLPVFSAVHLDESLHVDALKFHPWRWEAEGQNCKKEFTPFGGGPRFCPGSELAKVETAFFLYHLVLNFRWHVEGVDQAMAYPYVEFPSGLPLKLEVILSESSI